MPDKPPITRQMSSQKSISRKSSRAVSSQSSRAGMSLEFNDLNIEFQDEEIPDVRASLKRKRSAIIDVDDDLYTSISVEGLIIKKKDGVIFAPPSCMYCFNSNDAEQKQSVKKKIEKDKKEIEKSAEYAIIDCFSTTGKSLLFPSVVGGIDRGYLSVKRGEIDKKKKIKKEVKKEEDKEEEEYRPEKRVKKSED